MPSDTPGPAALAPGPAMTAGRVTRGSVPRRPRRPCTHRPAAGRGAGKVQPLQRVDPVEAVKDDHDLFRDGRPSKRVRERGGQAG